MGFRFPRGFFGLNYPKKSEIFTGNFLSEMAKTVPGRIREHADKNPECRDVLLKKAEATESGPSSLNKTREEMEELFVTFDSALEKVEEELATHTGGKYRRWCSLLCLVNSVLFDIIRIGTFVLT